MTTKINLDDLEAKARAAESLPSKWFTAELLEAKLGSDFWHEDIEHIAANSPPVTLALIALARHREEQAVALQIAEARIRELESIAKRALERWQANLECEIDYTEAESEEIAGYRALLEKGVVLP